METQGRGWRTLDEVARELQVSTDAVRRLVSEGKLAAAEIDGGLRFHPSMVERCARRAERSALLRRWRGRALMKAAVAAATLAGVVTLAASGPPLAGEKVPRQIPYRGYLDQNGAPVTNPAVTMRFELFTEDSENNENYRWFEEQTVSVLDGNFSVALGDGSPINPSLFAQPSLYLSILVDGQRLAGRQRILSVPYAHHSAASSAVPPGTVVAFMGQAPPAGWLLCNGTTFDAATYPALAAVLGTTTLPDLRARFVVGAGPGAGLTNRAVGETGGSEVHQLTQAELPSHTHVQDAHGHASDWYAWRNDAWGYHAVGVGAGHVRRASDGYGGGANDQPLVPMSATATNQSTGGNAPHSNMPPFAAVNWIIKAVY